MEYTVNPTYIERLERLQDSGYTATIEGSSINGLIEQAISTYLYEKEVLQGITPRVLPVVEIGTRRYYRDDRLKEYRNVENPHDRITY